MVTRTQTKIDERLIGSRVFKDGAPASRVFWTDEDTNEALERMREEDPSGLYVVHKYTKVSYLIDEEGDDGV